MLRSFVDEGDSVSSKCLKTKNIISKCCFFLVLLCIRSCWPKDSICDVLHLRQWHVPAGSCQTLGHSYSWKVLARNHRTFRARFALPKSVHQRSKKIVYALYSVDVYSRRAFLSQARGTSPALLTSVEVQSLRVELLLISTLRVWRNACRGISLQWGRSGP